MSRKLCALMLMVVFITTFLTGCGGGGAASVTDVVPDNNNQVIGKSCIAVDPYISGARFYIDSNNDGIYQDEELLSSISDENGKFSFNYDLKEGDVIRMHPSYKGVHLGSSYTGSLLERKVTGDVVGGNIILSPITTLKNRFNISDDDLSYILRQSFSESNNTLNFTDVDIYSDPMSVIEALNENIPSSNNDLKNICAAVSINSLLELIEYNPNLKTNLKEREDFINILKPISESVTSVINSNIMTEINSDIKEIDQKIKLNTFLKSAIDVNNNFINNIKEEMSSDSVLEISNYINNKGIQEKNNLLLRTNQLIYTNHMISTDMDENNKNEFIKKASENITDRFSLSVDQKDNFETLLANSNEDTIIIIGEDGVDGKSAYDIWIEAGNNGTRDDFLLSLKGNSGSDGQDGINGTDGKSAYEIWLDVGNVGTKEDFLDSLKADIVIPDFSNIYFGGGNGTKDSPYLVENSNHLFNVRYFHSSYFSQTKDIDLSDIVNWIPIQSFSGIYNGNGFSINNLTIDRSDSDIIGLFGEITYSSEIKNINLNNVNITGYGKVGSLVGKCSSGIIDNINVNGLICGMVSVGGLIGHNEGEISNIYTEGIISGSNYVGGICGENLSSINISESRMEINGKSNVGGLVGHGGIIQNSNYVGNIEVEKDYVGGLAGSGGHIIDSYFKGNISGVGYVGGLSGSTGIIENSYCEGNIRGESFIGGLVGYNGKVNNSHFIGDITEHIIDKNDPRYVGGLVGRIGEVTNSYSIVNIITECKVVGGLVGGNGNVSNSFAVGTISGDVNEIGGLVGENYNIYNIIQNSYSNVDITSTGDYIGGIIGSGRVLIAETYEMKIENCYSFGRVSVPDSLSSGGLAGSFFNGVIINSYYDEIKSTQDDLGKGTPKSTSELMHYYTFANWNWENTWAIKEGTSYPYLQWQGSENIPE